MTNKIISVLVWIAIGITVIWVAGFLLIKYKGDKDLVADISNPLDTFAQCLTDSGVKMYGADWCPHCQNQKKLFGAAFKFVDYTECADPNNPRQQTKACSDADISGYPTWKFPNSQKIEGEASFDDLSKKSGCEYR